MIAVKPDYLWYPDVGGGSGKGSDLGYILKIKNGRTC